MNVKTNAGIYHFGVTIEQEGKKLYDGPCKLDTTFAKIPKTGIFSITMEHGNLRGFVKMFHHFVSASNLLGIKSISPKTDWYECALTGKNVPAKVTVTFDNPHTARIMLYDLSIPTIVEGKWSDASKDSGMSLSRILHHSQRSGLEHLCEVGTSGKRILTASGGITGAMIEQFNTAKREIIARAGSESTKKPAKVTAKGETKPKVKTASKAEVKPKAKKDKPTLTPDQIAKIQAARELPPKAE
jgi:hypothetical protein